MLPMSYLSVEPLARGLYNLCHQCCFVCFFFLFADWHLTSLLSANKTQDSYAQSYSTEDLIVCSALYDKN